jgi:hypothetical protein
MLRYYVKKHIDSNADSVVTDARPGRKKYDKKAPGRNGF